MTRSAGRTPAVLFAAGAVFVCLLPISNPDMFWHLSAGRWIAENAAWPRADWLSHTRAGAPWYDFEWGAQIVWYALWEAGGFAALWALKAALWSACAALVWRICGLYGAAGPVRAAAAFFWTLASLPANDLRPENFSVLFFLFLIYALESRRTGGKDVLKGAPGWAAFFALWANIHAGFFYGLALSAVYAGVERIKRKNAALAACSMAGAAGALVNPYGTAVYRLLFEHWREREGLSAYIREWQGASIADPWLLPFWCLFAAAFAIVLSRFIKKRDVPYEHLIVLGALALSASAHVRTGVYFACAAVPFAVCSAARRGIRISRFARAAFIAASSAGFLFLGLKAGPVLAEASPVRSARWPIRLTRFLEEEADVLSKIPMSNPWDWGGYLGFRLWPRYRVSVDGRYLFHGFLGKAERARRNPSAYAAYLEELGAGLVVLQRTGQFLPVETPEGPPVLRPFYLAYLPPARWALVYWDAVGLVFVDRSAAPGKWLEKREYRRLRPGDWAAIEARAGKDARYREELRGEIERRAARRADAAEAAALRGWYRKIAEAAP